MKRIIVPALLTYTPDQFRHRLDLLAGFEGVIQIDVVDGLYGRASVQDIHHALRRYAVELDMMCRNPEQYLVAGVKRVFVQPEILSHDQIVGMQTWCMRHGCALGLAFNPGVRMNTFTSWVHAYHPGAIMVHGVWPGRSGQRMIATTARKCERLRALFPTLPLQVDGGVRPCHIDKLARVGVSELAISSAIFYNNDVRAHIAHLQSLFHNS